MNSANHYADVKESGIPWIGTVPAHWNIRTLYQLVTRVNNKNADLTEQNLLSLSYGKIKRRDINTNDGLLPASFDGYNIIEAGDIVLRLTDLQNDHTSLRVGHATERGIITSAYTTLRPIDAAHSRFLYYLIHAFDLKKGFYGMGSGVRQGLNYDEVKELRIVIPPQEEQDAIVRFLDEHCAKIDELIDEAKSSIEDYELWKKSVIYEAVTKGLNPSVPMIESGVDIIGLYPQNWKICRTRFLCSIMTGNQDTQNAVPNGKYPFYVRSPIVSRADVFTYDGEGILMAGDGAGAGRVFHHATGKYAIHQRVYCLYDFVNILPRFFFYYIENRFSVEMEKGSAQSTVPSVRLPMLLDFKVCVPPVGEQKEIVEKLDSIVSDINSSISSKKAFIDDLEKYKRSLIYEAVTGKRKVV